LQAAIFSVDFAYKVSHAVPILMITNSIAHWRSKMNNGKGISQAHLARRIGVGRSFVTKLEKGKAQPSAKLIFRVARYFKQPVESIFVHVDADSATHSSTARITMPSSQLLEFTPAPANPVCKQSAALHARPAHRGQSRDKSLVSPTAKVVASPVAQ
jgi:putative transcriptional regulator